MMQSNVLGFLGLLYPSRQVLIGEELWKRIDEVTLVIAATDLTSGESLRYLEKIKKAHKPLFQGFDSVELGHALGHDKVNFIGVLGKKAAMNFLIKAKKGEQDEKKANIQEKEQQPE